jgi:hypothetical protein
MRALDPEPLLRFLHGQQVRHILIGGVAVAAHGYRRPSADLDIVPAADAENLARLAQAMLALHARPADMTDFRANEMPADVTRVEDLALGGNFRLETDLGALDILQWISGIDADDLYTQGGRATSTTSPIFRGSSRSYLPLRAEHRSTRATVRWWPERLASGSCATRAATSCARLTPAKASW